MCADVLVGQGVHGLPAVALHPDQAGPPQHPQVLGDQRLAHPQPLDQLVHEPRLLRQLGHDRQPGRRGQHLQQLSRPPRTPSSAPTRASYKHMPICLCKYRCAAPSSPSLVLAHAGLTCIETQSQTMFLRYGHHGRLPAARQTPRTGTGTVLAGALARARGGGGRLREQRRARGRPRTATTVINAIGAENEYANVLSQIGGRYVHVSVDPEQPEHRPAHLRVEPERGPGGQRRAADRAERRRLRQLHEQDRVGVTEPGPQGDRRPAACSACPTAPRTRTCGTTRRRCRPWPRSWPPTCPRSSPPTRPTSRPT